MNVPAWSEIEHDTRLGLVLLADACRHMVRSEDRDNAVGAAMLGIKDLPDEALDVLIKDREFLSSVSIADTHLAACVRHCFDVITVLRPLEEVDLEAERAEGTAWLSYYLSLIPRETIGGVDYSGKFHLPGAPLVTILEMAQARVKLAEYVQNLVLTNNSGFGFTPNEISRLGRVDIRTVRNAMGPKGDSPIRTVRPRTRNDTVWGDPLDTSEWLAGRRGFQPGGLSAEWVSRNFDNIKSFETAAALPGLVTWLNGQSTDELATSLGWQVDRIRDWTRGRAVSPDFAEELAAATGLDRVSYRKLIERVVESAQWLEQSLLD
jgi:hypothetical protein